MRIVLDIANARLTEANWKKVLARAFRAGAVDLAQPLFGLHSLEEAQQIVAGLRDVLARLVELQSPSSQEASSLLSEIHAKARLQLDVPFWDRASWRLVKRWRTGSASFEEAAYAQLEVALSETGKKSLHRCEACEKLFDDPSRRRVRYCSVACRRRATAKEYREKNRDAYREYQRELMARRRKEGLA